MAVISAKFYSPRSSHVFSTDHSVPSNLHASAATIPHVPINLTRHSLNSVVARTKALWKPPLKWTSAHLSALGIHRHRRRDCQLSIKSSVAVNEEDGDSSDTDDECDHEGGEKEEEEYHVFIPDLTPEKISLLLSSFLRVGIYESRAYRLARLLLWVPRRPGDGGGDRRNYGMPGRQLSVSWMTPQLVVGPRMYSPIGNRRH
ncbi:hypothetical protein GQX73_g7118 [Xylaria multiplex]|uniref:Uncharacterized protein n=1 Tax=Xylaria multiplex TaxID=323545 RepID=A0A7C8MMA9_9PEZI|nr:hypothetical protein GQX73_g7118 [Xylaria multiplex]